MGVRVRNISDKQALIRCKSGLTVRLAPGEEADVERVDVGERIIRLAKRRVIALREVAGKGKLLSRDMTVTEAVEHIRLTPLGKLRGFLSPGEKRKTVLRAMKEKQRSK